MMYCVKCGVALADTEKKCPLCGTVPYHPEVKQGDAQPLYPENIYPKSQVNTGIIPSVMIILCLIPMVTALVCDLQINGNITWSGIVTASIVLCYLVAVLPFWFKNPNPVIFIPCDFVGIGLYLAYLNMVLDGDWFLSFAFPLVGGIAVIVTAVIALVRYVKKGHLYIFGGAAVALGAMMFPLEILINITFNNDRFIFWSLYPISVLVLIGGFLIFLAICRPAREAMERKFFV